MRKFKVTFQVEKELRTIANGLPTLYDRSLVYRPVLGKELKLTGHTVDDSGKELEDQKVYPLPVPSMNARNHYRRLRKAYMEHGEPGVLDYMDKVKAEMNELDKEIES